MTIQQLKICLYISILFSAVVFIGAIGVVIVASETKSIQSMFQVAVSLLICINSTALFAYMLRDAQNRKLKAENILKVEIIDKMAAEIETLKRQLDERR